MFVTIYRFDFFLKKKKSKGETWNNLPRYVHHNVSLWGVSKSQGETMDNSTLRYYDNVSVTTDSGDMFVTIFGNMFITVYSDGI